MKSTPPARASGQHDHAASPPDIGWEAAFEVMPEAALVLDRDGGLLAANGAARVLLGRRARTGARCCTMLGCRPDACVSIRALAGEHGQHQVELDDGAAAWASPVATAAGQVVVTMHRMAGPAGLPREELPPRLVVRALGRTSIERVT